MSLVPINSVLRHTLQLLAKIDPPGGLELLSYKRNRTVAILVLENDLVQVRERGYVNQTITIPRAQLNRTLKSMIKKEFPRSRQVRVFKLSDPGQVDRDRKTL